MDRSGPGIGIKILVVAVSGIVVQDILLIAMSYSGVPVPIVQIVLGVVLVLALVVGAMWGNAVARALRQLARACYVARKGDTNVLMQMPRADEIGQVNDEINRLVVLLRDLLEAESELGASAGVTNAVSQAGPDLLRTSQDILVSLKELREGAAADSLILRRVAGKVDQARLLSEQVARPHGEPGAAEEIASKLRSLGALSREAEFLADQVIDEVARPEIDEAALARAVNGMRDAARTMAEVAGQAIPHLERRRADAEAASQAVEGLRSAEAETRDGGRVAELMERSATSGLSAASRLASSLRRIGVLLEVYADRKRLEAGRTPLL
jgi:methyl-accepting chemotaxis protein